MSEHTLYMSEKEESHFWASFGYTEEAMVYCPMCEDTHENNSNCQRNDLYE
jgi:hypothetical protein